MTFDISVQTLNFRKQISVDWLFFESRVNFFSTFFFGIYVYKKFLTFYLEILLFGSTYLSIIYYKFNKIGIKKPF